MDIQWRAVGSVAPAGGCGLPVREADVMADGLAMLLLVLLVVALCAGGRDGKGKRARRAKRIS